MRTVVYCADLEPVLRENIAAHIRSHWNETVVYDETNNINLSSIVGSQAVLLIRSDGSPVTEIEAPLKETIVVLRTATVDEALFLVDAKLGRLTKSDMLPARKEAPRKQ